MTRTWCTRPRRLLLAALALSLAAGCGAPEAKFQMNSVYVAVQEDAIGEIETATEQNIHNVMFALFGTPDDPHLPSMEDVDVGEYLDIEKLRMAAGPVRRDESGRPRGLYREHCVHCHGITGDGQGPTAAFLNPYPRDYRPGIFKFKSTPAKEPPAHEDLEQILYDGIQGTAMPSFKLLASDEREALVEYVKYLAIRGEVERRLIFEAAAELELGALLVGGEEDNRDVVSRAVSNVVFKWQSADEKRVPIPQRPEMNQQQLAASIDRGRVLFHGTVANCVKCHGETAVGDGVQDDYDDWTKELNPKNQERVELLVDLGALEPRHAQPRNLRMGVYRGGRRPIDIYRRIVIGITGSPMPAAAMWQEGMPEDAPALTPDDVWDIVNYVRHLPYESASEPPQDQPSYRRDRL